MKKFFKSLSLLVIIIILALSMACKPTPIITVEGELLAINTHEVRGFTTVALNNNPSYDFRGVWNLKVGAVYRLELQCECGGSVYTVIKLVLVSEKIAPKTE